MLHPDTPVPPADRSVAAASSPSRTRRRRSAASGAGALGARRGDRGVATLEFAIIGAIAIVLLLGIIAFGFLLSFKQNLTQAAAEAARSVAGITDDPLTVDDEREPYIRDTLRLVTSQYASGCGDTKGVPTADGLLCDWAIHDCDDDTSDFANLVDTRPGIDECITVYIEFANSGDTKLLPTIPFISALEPDTISAQSTGRLLPA